MADKLSLDSLSLENKPEEPKNIGEIAQKFGYYSPFIDDEITNKIGTVKIGDSFEPMKNHSGIIVIRRGNRISIPLGIEYTLQGNTIPLGNDVSLKRSGKFFEVNYPGITGKDSITIPEAQVPEFRKSMAKLIAEYTMIQKTRLSFESIMSTQAFTLEGGAVRAFVNSNVAFLHTIHFPVQDEEKIARLADILDRIT